MDVVPLSIALVPLGAYLLLLGLWNLGRRPRLMSGTSDAALMGVGLAGLIAVGPMNLFLPDDAVDRFGIFAWPLLFALYGLSVILYILVARPRLIISNVSAEEVRRLLEAVAVRIDPSTKIAGDAIHLPQLGVQCHLEISPAMRNVTLVSAGDQQSIGGWKRLGRELSKELPNLEVARNPRGFTLLAFGLTMIVWPIMQLAQTPGNIAMQQLRNILRM
jgi:hypothetical protein